MPWMDDSRSSSETTDSIWLRFPQQIKNVGDRTEVRMRILAGDPTDPGAPVGVWTHWLQGKPFNCSRPQIPCPVCSVREGVSQERRKNEFPFRSKQFFNVLVTENGVPSVKVFSFGFSVSKELKSFAERYGDLRNYDVTVRKEQVGRLPMNVEYSVFYERETPLTEEQKEVSKNLHDLSQFTKPASLEELKQVARGIVPSEETQQDGVVSPDTMEREHLLGEIRKRIPQDLDLKNFGIYPDTPNEKLESLLKSLRGE